MSYGTEQGNSMIVPLHGVDAVVHRSINKISPQG